MEEQQDQSETPSCSTTSVPTWFSHSLGMELATEVPWVLPPWQSSEESTLSTSGEVPIHWDQAEIYKKRQLKTENWDWWIGDDDLIPKIPRQCPKPGCRNTQPCSTHPQGWANKNPDIPDLPPNWDKLKKLVPKTGGCWWIQEDGTR